MCLKHLYFKLIVFTDIIVIFIYAMYDILGFFYF